MTTKRFTSVGVVGLGYVGNAVRRWFLKHPQRFRVLLYDKYKRVGSFEEINKADIIFVAVPTPFHSIRGYDDSAVEEVLNGIGDGKIIVIKSTILPGSSDAWQKRYPRKTILFNPEFLRAKSAVADFAKPARQIIGFVGPRGYAAARRVLAILPPAPYQRVVKAREAEMIKYFSNTYLATRVVFANQMYDVCERLGGINYDVVKECLVQDKRIGDSHFDIFHEGYRGYSGGCFPKDVNAFLQFTKRLRVPMDVLEAAARINARLLRLPRRKMRTKK